MGGKGSGHYLTMPELRRIHELRADGYSCQHVADIIGCSSTAVWRHAPGRPGKVPNAPIREAFLASPMTASDVARELGWWSGIVADGSRVKRTLGLLPDVNGKGQRTWRTMVDAETVERIADVIGISPFAVLPDDGGVVA